MTPEEIKKITTEIVEKLVIDCNYSPNATLGVPEALRLLAKDYCIVPKSKVKEWQLIVEDALKADRVITEDAWRFMWERLFGKDTFEEEGK